MPSSKRKGQAGGKAARSPYASAYGSAADAAAIAAAAGVAAIKSPHKRLPALKEAQKAMAAAAEVSR